MRTPHKLDAQNAAKGRKKTWTQQKLVFGKGTSQPIGRDPANPSPKTFTWEHAVSDVDSGVGDSIAKEPRGRRKNASETKKKQVAGKDKASWQTNEEIEALFKAVAVHRGSCAKIQQDILDGKLQSHNKNVTQQSTRTFLRHQKTERLKHDRILPLGFDWIGFDNWVVKKVKAAQKNPWRSEADVDANGQPTNTVWDETQNPLPGVKGRRVFRLADTVKTGDQTTSSSGSGDGILGSRPFGGMYRWQDQVDTASKECTERCGRA